MNFLYKFSTDWDNCLLMEYIDLIFLDDIWESEELFELEGSFIFAKQI